MPNLQRTASDSLNKRIFLQAPSLAQLVLLFALFIFTASSSYAFTSPSFASPYPLPPVETMGKGAVEPLPIVSTGSQVYYPSGTYYFSETDLSIPARSIPMVWERTYRSNRVFKKNDQWVFGEPADGPMGYGWSSPWFAKIEGDAYINGEGCHPETAFPPGPPPGQDIWHYWPFNGSLTPRAGSQDDVCTLKEYFGATIHNAANNSKCIKNCCKKHDDCYRTYHCNATSWITPGFFTFTALGPCTTLCNMPVAGCVSFAI